MSAPRDGEDRSSGAHPPLAAFLHRLFRRLLPRDFRTRYGAEMASAFREGWAEARAGEGRLGAVWFVARELADVAMAAVRVRWRGRRTGGETMGDVVRELGVALRTLVRRPGFAIMAVATIAVGVGGTTAIFTLVDDVLLAPLPYPESERLVHVFQTNPELGWERGPVSFPNFDDWRRENTAFESLSAYFRGVRRTLLGHGAPRQISGSAVTGEIFHTLRASPLLGRTFTRADEGADREPVLILSHGLWETAFGADPGVVGRSVDLGDETYTVVGVMPAGFAPPWERDEFWVPFTFDAAEMERDQNFLAVLGRLRDGVTLEEARARMVALSEEIRAIHSGGNADRRIHMETRADVVAGHVKAPLLVLLGAVTLLLVIACANLAGLTLVRSASRRREMAIRAALGGARPHLVRTLFAESAVLAAMGAAAAVPVAGLILRGLVAFAPPDLPRRAEIALDPVSVAFALVVTALCAAAFGLIPAWRSARGDLRSELGGSARGTLQAASIGQRGVVAMQVALAVILLTGAGLLGGSFLRLEAVERGFEEDGVLSFRVLPPAGAYEDAEELDAFYRGLQDALEKVPGVEAVGAGWLPFGDAFGSSTYMVDGRPDDDSYLLQLVPIRGEYFDALGVELLRGRTFRPGEGLDGPPPVIVNQRLAERVWPGEDPLGKRLRKGSGEDAVYVEVVGIVPDLTLMSLGEEPFLQSFWPHGATPWARDLYFVLRTEGDPLAAVSAARAAVARVDDRVPLADVSTMARRLDRQLATPRFRTLLVISFAALAALLAALGIYGTTSYVVTRSTREIGMRMALGAERRRVLIGVVGHGLRPVTLGALAGAAGAAALSGTVRSVLYRVDPLEPGFYLGAVAAVVGVATLATWAPALRASATDPAEALRVE